VEPLDDFEKYTESCSCVLKDSVSFLPDEAGIKSVTFYRDVLSFKKKGRVETLPCSDPTKQSHEIPARHSVFSSG
jgi:hypothetical protein